MRVGVDASNLRGGGGVTHLAAVLGAADPPTHGVSRVTVWAGSRTFDSLPSRPWLERILVPDLEKGLPWRLAWQRRELPRLAAAKSDLLWVPGGNATGTFRPLVTMCQNMLPFEPSERRRYGRSWVQLRLVLLGLAQSRSFRRADGLIFLSEYARSRVLQKVGGVRGRVTIIPHGVDESFRRTPRDANEPETFSAARPFRLLYVSIVDLYKHPWVVVEAVRALRDRGLSVELDLVGGFYPPAMVRLRRVLQRVDPEGRHIRYVGPVPHRELPSVYHRADGFVFASSCENLPNILLEAMASALPIASSDRGPMPSLLGDGGVYFDPEQVDSVAKAIKRLVDDRALRERCAAEAYRRSTPYTWERCSDQTFGFLAEVARFGSAAR